jgi:hypothetical protein
MLHGKRPDTAPTLLFAPIHGKMPTPPAASIAALASKQPNPGPPFFG